MNKVTDCTCVYLYHQLRRKRIIDTGKNLDGIIFDLL